MADLTVITGMADLTVITGMADLTVITRTIITKAAVKAVNKIRKTAKIKALQQSQKRRLSEKMKKLTLWKLRISEKMEQNRKIMYRGCTFSGKRMFFANLTIL